MPHSKTRRKRRHDEHRDRWLGWLALFVLARAVGTRLVTLPAPAPSGPFGPWRNRPLPTVLSQAELAELAAAVGFPDPHLAAAVAMAESAGHTDATNVNAREASIGLWQINTRAHPELDAVALLDPHYNAAQAVRLSQGGTDWSPWGAFTDGGYKNYL